MPSTRYGVLSRERRLRQACADAGVVFIGRRRIIPAHGEQDEAKRIMEAEGVAVVRAYGAGLDDRESPTMRGRKIGYRCS